MQLKRFEFSHFGAAKLDKPTAFSTVLDLAPCMIENEEPVLYDLCSVVVHLGKSSRSGHYVSYVKSPSGSWLLMDDSSVSRITEDTLYQQKPYMVFYTKRTTSPQGASLMK